MEMVRSNVPRDKIYDLVELRQCFLRLFPHLHAGERRFQAVRQDKQGGRRRQVLLTQPEEESAPSEEEASGDSAGSAHAGGCQEDDQEDYDRQAPGGLPDGARGFGR